MAKKSQTKDKYCWYCSNPGREGEDCSKCQNHTWIDMPQGIQTSKANINMERKALQDKVKAAKKKD